MEKPEYEKISYQNINRVFRDRDILFFTKVADERHEMLEAMLPINGMYVELKLKPDSKPN